MGQQGMYLDVADLWPPAGDLVGLQFDSEGEFARCQAALSQYLDRYRTTNQWDLFVVVRKADLPLLQDAGLTYTMVELVEAAENPTAEARVQQRSMMKRYMRLWLEELGWDTQ